MPNMVTMSAIQPLQHVFIPPDCNPYSPDFHEERLVSDYRERCIQLTLDLLDQAGRRGSDIVSTSEDMTGAASFVGNLDHPHLLALLAEPIPGPLTERIGQLARQYSMYVVACFVEQDGARFFNTAVLIDRKGELMGRYRKVHCTVTERWQITPGDSYPVFETDFGKLGMLICYDLWFPEAASILALKGADVILNPTYGYGPGEVPGLSRLRTRALDNYVYLVVSKTAYMGYLISLYPGRSSIVSPWGHIIASADYRPNVVVTATVDLVEKRENPGNLISCNITEDARISYLLERRVETYGELGNPLPSALAPYSDAISLTEEEKRAYFENVMRPMFLKRIQGF